MSEEEVEDGKRASDVSVEGGRPRCFYRSSFLPSSAPSTGAFCPARVDISLHLQQVDGPTIH